MILRDKMPECRATKLYLGRFANGEAVGRRVVVSGDDIGRKGMSVVSIWANYHKVDGTIAWGEFSQAK